MRERVLWLSYCPHERGQKQADDERDNNAWLHLKTPLVKWRGAETPPPDVLAMDELERNCGAHTPPSEAKGNPRVALGRVGVVAAETNHKLRISPFAACTCA